MLKLILVILLSFAFTYFVICSNDTDFLFRKQKVYVNANNLDLFYYRVAVISLMKAKAKSVLLQLPSTEKYVYEQCESEANTPNTLAKCLVSLLNIRDNFLETAPSKVAAEARNFSGIENPALTSLREENIIEDSWMSLMLKKLWRHPNLIQSVIKNLTKDMLAPILYSSKEFQGVDINEKKSSKNDSEVQIGETNYAGITKTSSSQQISTEKQHLTKENTKEVTSNKSNGIFDSQHISKNILNNYLLYHKYSYYKRSDKNALLKEAYPEEIKKRQILKKLSHLSGRRKKRKIQRIINSEEHNEKVFEKSHTDRLKNIQKFYKLVNHCTKYMRRAGEANSKYLKTFKEIPTQVKFRVEKPIIDPLVDEAEDRLNHYLVKPVSILSPNLFSLFSNKMEKTEKNSIKAFNSSSSLWSPTLFSFQNDGAFALPSLLGAALSNHEKIAWLELLLEISGAGTLLRRLTRQIEPKIKNIEEKIYPSVLKLEDLQKRFNMLQKSHSSEQKNDFKKIGYTILNEEFTNLSTADLEEIIEQDIRKIAKLEENDLEILAANYTHHNRFKRFTKTGKLGQLRMLDPFYFTNQISDGAVLRHVALSPRAFGASMLSPEFFSAHILSPSAFAPSILSPYAAVANVLSPNAFTTSVLSPTAISSSVLSPRAFFASVLSPRALSAFVLNPKVFVLEVISPKMFDFNVGSSQVLSFSVLTPTILSPSVASPLLASTIVLSPNILSPNFLSTGQSNLMVCSMVCMTIKTLI